jgi:hypothetical protein
MKKYSFDPVLKIEGDLRKKHTEQDGAANSSPRGALTKASPNYSIHQQSAAAFRELLQA